MTEPSTPQKFLEWIDDASPLDLGGLALMVFAVGMLVSMPYFVKSRRGGILAGLAAAILGVVGYVAFDIVYLVRHRALYGVSEAVRVDCERLLASQNARGSEQEMRLSRKDPDFPDSFRKIGAVFVDSSYPGTITICFGDGSFSTVCYLYDPHRLHTKVERRVPLRAMWYRDFYVFVAPGE